jgi:hypothetical protein
MVGAGKREGPFDVVRDRLAALMAGDERVVLASSGKPQECGDCVPPDGAEAAMRRKIAEPGAGDDG